MNVDASPSSSGVVNLIVSIASATAVHLFIESLLVATLVYVIVFRRSKKEKDLTLTEEEKEELIAEWEPEPLVPDTPQDHPALNRKYVEGKFGKYVSIEGKEYLNFATSNFLGLVGDERIEEVAKKTIFKYGVGSCGPRGFYGTVDVHLELEKQLAEFLGCEEAVLYSYGFATIASAIPAYAKRGDVIFADKGVNFAIQKGLQASRSRIVWFEHNDVEDLERLLLEQAELDRKKPKLAATTRRFMVVEGLYAKSGDLCPLPELLELKWKYKVRIFIDESVSFGVIGNTGRGVTEYYDVKMIDVDMIMASLENAVASTGGFCAGRSFVVGHQRLSGLGYCFSASLPPLLATAASEALRIMDAEPERFERLHASCKALHLGLRKAFIGTKFDVRGCELSPVQHVIYRSDNKETAEKKLDALVDRLFEKMIVVTRARYLEKEEAFAVEPSIRVMTQSEISDAEMVRFLDAVRDASSSL